MESLDKAVEIANAVAPEHLELCLDEPFTYLEKIKHAGSVFLGRYTPEALGDYFAGANHTLPTSGTARFSSPLSVDDFIKKTQYIYYEKSALEKVCKDVAYFAEQEGLTAHAKSAICRFEEEVIASAPAQVQNPAQNLAQVQNPAQNLAQAQGGENE